MLAGKPFGTTQYYPDDFDTTSIAWSVLPVSPQVVKSVLDEILTLKSEDGLVTVFISSSHQQSSSSTHIY